MDAKTIIKQFDLQPHPEGGFYKEIYRSNGVIPNSLLSNKFAGDRNYCTSIYFLLTGDKFSSFHKINQEETWHFYSGNCISLHLISPDGVYEVIKIGSNYESKEVPQFTVPAEFYFAAEVTHKTGFAFVGCTVSPGFDFRDFYLPKRSDLVMQYPQHREVITRLTYF